MNNYTYPEQILEYLKQNQIKCETTSHKAVYTVEESKTLENGDEPGHIKNLFLKDKKRNMFLVTAHQDAEIDLKVLPEALGVKRLSFCSEVTLNEALGVEAGAVTPLALINDTDVQVSFWIDSSLLSGK